MLTIKKEIASNTLYQILGKIFTSLSTLIGTALITRYLGASTFGEYSIVMVYLTTFYTISDFGINSIIIKEFAKSKEFAIQNFKKILVLRVMFGLTLLILAALIVVFMPYAQNVKLAIYIGLPLLILNSISKAAAVIFQAYLKYKYQTISMAIGSVIGILLIAYVVFGPLSGLVYIIIATVIGSAISPFISIYFVKNYISKKSKAVDLKYWKDVIFDSFPLGISLILNTLMIQIDRIFLSILSTPNSVGIYNLAYRIFELILVFPTFFMNAMYPVLVRLKDGHSEEYNNAVYKLLKYISIFGITISILGIFLSKYFIPLIWGVEMIQSVVAFNILISGLIFFFVSAPLSWLILIEGKHKVLPYIYGSGFTLNALLNVIVIPKFDYVGAGVVTVITEAIVVFMLVISLKLYKHKTMSNRDA